VLDKAVFPVTEVHWRESCSFNFWVWATRFNLVVSNQWSTMARSVTILLVEDEPNDAVLAHLALQKIMPGVSLPMVSDGIQAIEYLKGAGPYADRSAYPFPDVVLLDLKLPLLDGFEVLRWIRLQPELKLLPVIGLTGSLRNEDATLACEGGANLCVLKSQGFRRLAEMVMQVGGANLTDTNIEKPITPAQGSGTGETHTVGELASSESASTNLIVPGEDLGPGEHRSLPSK
jgi:CheY-like chemotaxis protein